MKVEIHEEQYHLVREVITNISTTDFSRALDILDMLFLGEVSCDEDEALAKLMVGVLFTEIEG